MAIVRTDLVGTVMAVSESYRHVVLAAGDTIPEGFWIGGHLVQGGDPADQAPPWAPSGSVSVSWADITDKPAVIAAGATQAAARTSIGAGTSSLTLGTAAGTALAGNGTAAAATKLATARTITLTGAANGSASFDGTADATITTTGA